MSVDLVVGFLVTPKVTAMLAVIELLTIVGSAVTATPTRCQIGVLDVFTSLGFGFVAHWIL